MASSSPADLEGRSLEEGGNLLMTLPPELRNEIYALVITSDFYELDPTVSAKAFPRPRYGIFGIQRGIKAQGGTPPIAQTCQQIRAEALDVYYGRNTFALVGDETTQATKTQAIKNRVDSLDWINLIGDDARYLRKVRVLLRVGHSMENYLVSVVSSSSGSVPTVTVVNSRPKGRTTPSDDSVLANRAQKVETAIHRRLKETSGMGEVWRALIERALYPVDFSRNDFDISEEGIKKDKVPVKKSLSAKKIPKPPKPVNEAETSGRFVDLRKLVDLGDDDPDFWETGPPPAAKKHAPDVDVGAAPKPATRASTRKKVPRKP